MAGHAVVDGGLMIDLSLLKAIRVDPAAGTVRAAGGVLLGELDRATQQFGLAVPSGIVSHTGIGGLTLGGGLGHTMRKFGLTVDNLLAVDLVTTDGQRLRVDAGTEPELFWGSAAAAGTRDRRRLRVPAASPGPGPARRADLLALADAPEVLRFARDFAPQAPDELGLAMFARLARRAAVPRVCTAGRSGLVPVWAGDPAEGLGALAALRRIGRPGRQPAAPAVPVPAVDGGRGNQHGLRYYWRSQRIPELRDEVIDVVAGSPTPSPRRCRTSPGSSWAGPPAGSTPRPPPWASAATGSSSSILAGWPPPDPGGDRHVAWVRRGWTDLRPHSAGVYSHFLSDEGPAGVAAAYSGRLRRLIALKDRWDPDNFFRMNANIPPSRRRCEQTRSETP